MTRRRGSTPNTTRPKRPSLTTGGEVNDLNLDLAPVAPRGASAEFR